MCWFTFIITTNIKVSSEFNYKVFNFGIEIGEIMKKIIIYFLISSFLISQENIESTNQTPAEQPSVEGAPA